MRCLNSIISLKLLFFLYGCLIAQDNVKIIQISSDFLNLLKAKNQVGLEKILYEKVEIKYFSEKEFFKLVDMLMYEKVSPLEFIIKTTGRNIYMFLNKFEKGGKIFQYEILDFKLSDKVRIEIRPKKDNLFDSFFYLDSIIDYKILEFSPKTQKIISTKTQAKRIELNILQDTDKTYKIFGFIM